MSLIQLLKFREVEKGLHKIPHFQMGVFEIEATVVSWLWNPTDYSQTKYLSVNVVPLGMVIHGMYVF